jgi:tRNA G18 (ribose-2'-O)-methylase SpoU
MVADALRAPERMELGAGRWHDGPVGIAAEAGAARDAWTTGWRRRRRTRGSSARRAAPLRSTNGLETLLDGLRSRRLLLVLDGVQDPRNLGACLRSADAAGGTPSSSRATARRTLTPAARKAAAGAAESVPLVRVVNLARCLRTSRLTAGIWVVGADAGGHARISRPTCPGRWRWCWAARAPA